MNPPSNLRAGMVVSDLHLFARRSIGRELMRDLAPDLRSVQFVVLNGDITDFRWSVCANHQETLRATIAWLVELIDSLPNGAIHYVLGNHDCLTEYRPALNQLAAERRRFHWHELSVQLGDALFLHGDCAHGQMNRADLRAFRDRWSRSRRRGRTAARAYQVFDRLGATQAAHRWHFPLRRTLDRMTYYLDDSHDGWRASIRRCYFGHTHEPFENVEHEGIVFHNTGSAIRGMRFNPLKLTVKFEDCPSARGGDPSHY